MVDRKSFFGMCQKCAMLPKTACVAIDVPQELLVVWHDMIFYPIGYELQFDKNGNPVHSAILHDLKANSVARVDLSEVSVFQTSQLDKL